jgi:hypothetical protein
MFGRQAGFLLEPVWPGRKPVFERWAAVPCLERLDVTGQDRPQRILVLTGGHRVDLDALCEMMAAICDPGGGSGHTLANRRPKRGFSSRCGRGVGRRVLP